MHPAKLQLSQYFIDEASFTFLEDVAVDLADDEDVRLLAEDVHVEASLGEHQSDKSRTLCELFIGMHESPRTARFPYQFEIALTGYFEIATDCTKKDREMLMTITAPSMLYSAAREYLLLMTGRARYHPLLLPSVSFTPQKRPRKVPKLTLRVKDEDKAATSKSGASSKSSKSTMKSKSV